MNQAYLHYDCRNKPQHLSASSLETQVAVECEITVETMLRLNPRSIFYFSWRIIKKLMRLEENAPPTLT
ncbi:hypothetical protein GOBAR_AA18901 [Gossypium barbadense]|uniref:Uncharacterized protein n=1 Tax=Gossypium barbadense TaxID=3634 RepID=A0A2P5XEI7_GOSBA|nr:hypothetical protein GOBAR_AA18901 [Gossypium barbadense]